MRGVIEWVLEHLYVVVFILVFLGQLVRGFFNTRKGRPPPQPLPDEMDEQRRVREIQEQIRRRIAERRGEEVRNDPPVLAREEAPPPRAEEPVPRRIETT